MNGQIHIKPIPQGSALVTGATGIIGEAVCRTLSRDGWAVIANDISHDKFRHYENLRGRPIEADFTVPCDLSVESNCQRLVAEAERMAGAIGLLVNCATAHDRVHTFEDTNSAFCQKLLQVDLLAPLFLSQAAAASLEKTQGSIVNCSSVHVQMPIPGSPFYRIVKAAVEKLSETLVTELGPRGIRINTIRIGRIAGDAFLQPVLQKLQPDLARDLYDEVIPSYLASQREKGSGVGEDIGQIVSFLASPRARFIQGAVISADGGWPQKRQSIPDGQGIVSEWVTNPEKALSRWLEEREK